MSEANLEVERLSFSSISRPEHRNLLKEGFGAEIGEGACGPLPLAPNPKGTTPQSAAADSSPYTGEPRLTSFRRGYRGAKPPSFRCGYRGAKGRLLHRNFIAAKRLG